jgi:PII-like signaling protein
MLKSGPAKRLTIFVNESARWHGRAAYMALLDLFRHRGLAGATVTRGIAGYTGRGAVSSIDHVELASALPIRIEVTDAAEKIENVLPDVYDIVDVGLVEVQDTMVVKYAGTQESGGVPAAVQMRLIGKAKALQIHIGEDDKWEGAPLYEAIVTRARQLDIAGATVYRGVLGYGAHKRIHKHKTLALSHDDPIMISVVDEEEKINKLLAALETMIRGGCMISVADVTVVKYEEHPSS